MLSVPTSQVLCLKMYWSGVLTKEFTNHQPSLVEIYIKVLYISCGDSVERYFENCIMVSFRLSIACAIHNWCLFSCKILVEAVPRKDNKSTTKEVSTFELLFDVHE